MKKKKKTPSIPVQTPNLWNPPPFLYSINMLIIISVKMNYGNDFCQNGSRAENVLTKNCSKGMWVMDYRIVSDYGTSVPKVYG